MADGILMVDDEPALLDGLRRQLRGRFAVETAVGAESALALLPTRAWAVVVSDLRMPVMDGVRLLAEVRERTPDSTRIMLTGQADVTAAIQAVNRGNLFRFLTKPCPIEELAAALEAGLAQHRLIIAERELLEKTLSGSVKVLTDILAMTSPRAFSRAQRLRRSARRLAEAVGHPAPWQVELAAMLSPLGAVTLPPDLVDRADRGAELRDDEQQMIAGLPEVTARLLANIPRLEPCARMILLAGGPSMPPGDDGLARGARVLRLMTSYEHLIASGSSVASALGDLRLQGHPQAAIDALSTLDAEPTARRQLAVTVRELRPGMVLDEDVRAGNGILLVTRGQELTGALIERVTNFHRLVGLHEPIRVSSAGA